MEKLMIYMDISVLTLLLIEDIPYRHSDKKPFLRHLRGSYSRGEFNVVGVVLTTPG
jgi:hypothetical protein